MAAVTQWFPPDIKPFHFGEYESTVGALYESGAGTPHNFQAYWDGGQWRWRHNGSICHFQDRSWRGLADKSQSGMDAA